MGCFSDELLANLAGRSCCARMTLCDDNGSFIAVFYNDANDAQQVDYFASDGVTPYVPEGNVVKCGDETEQLILCDVVEGDQVDDNRLMTTVDPAGANLVSYSMPAGGAGVTIPLEFPVTNPVGMAYSPDAAETTAGSAFIIHGSVGNYDVSEYDNLTGVRLSTFPITGLDSGDTIEGMTQDPSTGDYIFVTSNPIGNATFNPAGNMSVYTLDVTTGTAVHHGGTSVAYDETKNVDIAAMPDGTVYISFYNPDNGNSLIHEYYYYASGGSHELVDYTAETGEHIDTLSGGDDGRLLVGRNTGNIGVFAYDVGSWGTAVDQTAAASFATLAELSTEPAEPGAEGFINTFVRHTVYSEEDGSVAETFDTLLDMVTPYTFQGEVTQCSQPTTGTVLTETGCLSSPASVDLSEADRCNVREITIGSDTIEVNIPAGWTVQELADAVNAELPNSLRVEGSSILVEEGVAIQNFSITCRDATFIEDFGTGGTDGNRLTSPVTDYIFVPSGLIEDGEYAITSFQDTGLAAYHTGDGNITADSQGDLNGNAFFVGADDTPNEIYRRPESVVMGKEYSVSLFVIDTTIEAADLNPNLDIIIEDGFGTEIAFYNTGDISPRDRQWREINFDFVATSGSVEFVIRNAGQGGFGNDYAVDHISFNTVTRQRFTMVSNGSIVPVEIVKVINTEGAIETLRVFSPDGNVEYPYPFDGLVLSTGECQILASDGSAGSALEYIIPNDIVSSGVGSTTGGVMEVAVANVGGTAVTFNNVAIQPGESVTYRGYYDHAECVFRKIASMSYDATGGSLHIMEIL